tara:strand:- start:3177 stop:3503 length:327 start_codon:yes stop_codon:yes gene_type:complete
MVHFQKKFNNIVRKDMRVNQEKSDVNWTKKQIAHQKKNMHQINDEDAIPSEFFAVKNFMAGKKKQNLDKEHIFDVNGDDKPIKVKKLTKADKLRRPFKMYNGKKFHSL